MQSHSVHIFNTFFFFKQKIPENHSSPVFMVQFIVLCFRLLLVRLNKQMSRARGQLKLELMLLRRNNIDSSETFLR